MKDLEDELIENTVSCLYKEIHSLYKVNEWQLRAKYNSTYLTFLILKGRILEGIKAPNRKG